MFFPHSQLGAPSNNQLCYLETSSTTTMATALNDENEWYTADCGECIYTLPTRYQSLAPMRQEASGSVIRATDTVTGKDVAIKEMLQPFQSPIHAERTYRELKLLTYLNHPDAQVVQLYNVFTPEKNLEDFKTLYCVFNFVDYDLNQVIKRRVPFPEYHIKIIIYLLLRGLKFIHSAGIIHRDLNPRKIGVDKNLDVTILDFGVARVALNDKHNDELYPRWWRAPDTFLSWQRYDEKIDIWSIGCIMAQLILLRPLFNGDNCFDQINKIFDVVGTPDYATLIAVCEPNALDYIIGLPIRPKQDFDRLFGLKYNPESPTPTLGVSPEGIDFLDRLLTFDHRKRPTADEALSHPFLDEYRNSSDEPTIQPIIDEHQDGEYTIEQWKSLIWQMIEEFQPPAWATEKPDADQ